MGSGREGEYLRLSVRPSRAAAATVTRGAFPSWGPAFRTGLPIAGWATTGLSVEWRPAAPIDFSGASTRLTALGEMHFISGSNEIQTSSILSDRSRFPQVSVRVFSFLQIILQKFLQIHRYHHVDNVSKRSLAKGGGQASSGPCRRLSASGMSSRR